MKMDRNQYKHLNGHLVPPEEIKYLTNLSGKVDLMEIWEMTTTFLMWPWPERMVSRSKLTRWSWLGMSSLLNHLTVNITSTTLTSWSISTALSNRQEVASAGEPLLSCHTSPNSITRGRWWSSQPSLGNLFMWLFTNCRQAVSIVLVLSSMAGVRPPPPSWQCQDFHGFFYSHPSLIAMLLLKLILKDKILSLFSWFCK